MPARRRIVRRAGGTFRASALARRRPPPRSCGHRWRNELRGQDVGLYHATDVLEIIAPQPSGPTTRTAKHDGRWLRAEGESQTQTIATFAGQVVPHSDHVEENADGSEGWKCEEGDLNPRGCRDFSTKPRGVARKMRRLWTPHYPGFPRQLPPVPNTWEPSGPTGLSMPGHEDGDEWAARYPATRCPPTHAGERRARRLGVRGRRASDDSLARG